MKETLTRLEFENKQLLAKVAELSTTTADAAASSDTMEEVVRAKEEREALLKTANSQIRDLEAELAAANKKSASLTEEANVHLTNLNAQNSAVRNAEAEVAGEKAKVAAALLSAKESLEGAKEESEGKEAAYEATVTKLSAVIKSREAAIEKVTKDKHKIEVYTKQTLNKFQDKYLAALKECKDKLKQEKEKNDLLEARTKKDRQAQKREERLLSSSLYELGLTMMKQQLKA